MDRHVLLNVPPTAQTARLLSLKRRWGISYHSTLGDTEGRVEFRQIGSDTLRADQVDPTDTEAVIAHIERRLHSEGYDTARKPVEERPTAASWDISRRARS